MKRVVILTGHITTPYVIIGSVVTNLCLQTEGRVCEYLQNNWLNHSKAGSASSMSLCYRSSV